MFVLYKTYHSFSLSVGRIFVMGRKAIRSMPKVRFARKTKCGTNGKPVKVLRKSAGRPRNEPVPPAKAYIRPVKKASTKLKQKITDAAREVNREPRFRFRSKTYGLTYSDANHVGSPQEILDFLQDKIGAHACTVCQEAHKHCLDTGVPSRHFHASGKMDRLLAFEGADWFDYTCMNGVVVHPNINIGGRFWERYCRKGGFYVTTVPDAPRVMHDALATGSVGQALNHIMVNDTNAYVRFATSLESNLARHFRRTSRKAVPVWSGPYPACRYPTEWNPETHSLHLWGPPGAGKTTFAMHLLREHYGQVAFIKGHVEMLKSLDFTMPFVFDEGMFLGEPPETSREVTDVVSGGTINARYHAIEIPPGIPRVFTSNSRWIFKNPEESVYNRRVVQHEFTLKPVIDEWRLTAPEPADIRPPPRPPTPEQPPPPPPGSPPPGRRSPPPPPMPEPDNDATGMVTEPDDVWAPIATRWSASPVVALPVTPHWSPPHADVCFSPGWDFLLPFDNSFASDCDPFTIDEDGDTIQF